MQQCKVLELHLQVLNPDFETNMRKNWAEFRQPSRADGFTVDQKGCTPLCSAKSSAQLRAARKGQLSALHVWPRPSCTRSGTHF